MNIQKEHVSFKALQNPAIFERIVFCPTANLYATKEEFQDCLFTINTCNEINFGWKMWQMAKAAVPEGFVLVQKSKINILYQDSDDPENFCRFKDDFNSLGGCIDGDEIMVVDIHESTQIGTKKAFGVWRSKIPIDIESDFVLVESREEAEQILIANKAMLEVREQSHD